MKTYLTVLTRFGLWLATVSALGLAACASPMPKWEAQMGDSVRSLRAAQVIDLDAPTRNGTRAPTHDGKAAVISQDRYVDSYKEPPPQNIFVIGTPTTGGGGK